MKALQWALEEMPFFLELKKDLAISHGVVQLTGCLDVQKANLSASLVPEGFAALSVCENELKARTFAQDWKLYDREVVLYPAKDMIFYQSDISGNVIMRQRLQVVRALTERKEISVVTSTGGCMDKLYPLCAFEDNLILIETGKEYDLQKLEEKLVRIGYERVSRVEAPGQFAVRGGIADIYDMTAEAPWRIEFWGEEVESIRMFSAESQRSFEECDSVSVFPASDEAECLKEYKNKRTTLCGYFAERSVVFVDEPARVFENARVLYDEYAEACVRRLEKGQIKKEETDAFISPEMLMKSFEKISCAALSLMDSNIKCLKIKRRQNVVVRAVNSYHNQFALLMTDLKKWRKAGYRIVLISASVSRGKRLADDLCKEGLNAFYSENDDRYMQPSEICVLYGNARAGFEYPIQKFVLITETDIFGSKKRKKHKKIYDGKNISSFAELSVGDYVVHESHGMGIYRGIEQIEREGTAKDYIKIEYAGGDNLYIQATQLDSLQKYGSAPEHKTLRLNRLGGNDWNRTKTRVRAAVKDMADELVALYSVRQKEDGFVFDSDNVWQTEFEELFPYEETEGQLEAIEAVKSDMESAKIMDRLICGDVGYGKTEVAIRAAFKAVQSGKQVAMLVPTTILAQQHFDTFSARMSTYPVNVSLLSRFRTKTEQAKTIADINKGVTDIVIGTHRLLSKDVKFKNLGLLIVDEEQRFGVSHKEKIKQLRSTVDALTLSATPIPRTLHMSLIGIRDMSVLQEAPQDRVPIQTYISEYDEEIVREAISRELARDGQVYYVYNRVSGIADVAARLQSLVPEANIAYAHGQMKERELEQVMYSFINKEIDVLVSTTIIETGMDISNVNTLIIHDADRMGLSQLYQLRGRVGRMNRTAYAFLMYRKDKMLSEIAEKRLHAIMEFTELGSGIKIAMRDLELRGAGNVLGAEQSGHMEAVGYDLYCKMLAEAVSEAKGNPPAEDFETMIDVQTDAFIPDNYIRDEAQKVEIYRRIAAVTEEESVELTDELMDRFGKPPRSVQNLIRIALLKEKAHALYITELKQQGRELKIEFYERARLRVENMEGLLSACGGKLLFYARPVVYMIYQPSERDMLPTRITETIRELLDTMRVYLGTR